MAKVSSGGLIGVVLAPGLADRAGRVRAAVIVDAVLMLVFAINLVGVLRSGTIV